MLYGNESISHYKTSNVIVWMVMAFQAGFLNVGGFMACHRFVSHITGFAAFLGVELKDSHYHQALGMLVVPAFFLLGAIISGWMVDIRLKLHKDPKYYVCFGVMFFLILIVFLAGYQGYFGIFGEPLVLQRDYTLLALLCLICGMQNGMITTVSNSVIRTTHLTGITTDLGIGLVRLVYNKQLASEDVLREQRASLMRIGIILFFTLGSVVGAFAFKEFGYDGFLVPVLITGGLFIVMCCFRILRRLPKLRSL